MFENILLASLLILLVIFSYCMIVFKPKKYHIYLIILLMIELTILLVRFLISGHIPFANIYESLIFFSFIYLLKLLLLQNLDSKSIGFLSIPSLVIVFIALLFPAEGKVVSPLMPALRSIWLFIHVPSIFIGYVSVFFLAVLTILRSINNSKFKTLWNNELKSSIFFLTLGIITGAYWGDQSWGRFWSWDPKESWAAITWFILVVVMHVKNRKIQNLLIFVALFALLFTYFGVTYLLPGLHSYG